MKPQIDTTYRTEKLLDWESQSLSQKFETFSLSRKSTWFALGITVFVIFVAAIIMPLLPPRFGWSNWLPSASFDDYKFRISTFLIIMPVILLIGFICLIIRNAIDLRSGIKRTANFKVTDVINLGVFKILILNGWRLFSLKDKDDQFNAAAKGQIIHMKRTCTYRLINYYLRDEEVFLKEEPVKSISIDKGAF